MARPVVLSNGSLLVGLNIHGLVHDFYYPHVGLENHAAGRGSRHKIGVWIDGTISWLDSGEWSISLSTAEHALVGHVFAKNEQLGVLLEFDDFVAATTDVFVRTVNVVNTRDEPREIRLFMHQAFTIGDSRGNGDTAQYLPDSNAILHYHGNRAFVISGQVHDGEYFDQHSIGLFGIEGREGTYRDADDGELGQGMVEHGRVDSTLRFNLRVGAHDSKRVHYWIAAGLNTRNALDIHKTIQQNSIYPELRQTIDWWHEWLKPAYRAISSLDQRIKTQFIKSIMIVKAHTDKDGAVIASSDTTMLNYARDAYAYCWPRDGAYALWPLIRMGYTEEALAFFKFCKQALHPNGYLMHKYQADGALGSSWHPYVHGDISAPPIQEDETALVLFVFIQYYYAHPETKLLDEFYDELVKPMSDFLATYVEAETNLPKPSYDLWEEHFLTSTYTTALTAAALLAASEIANERGDSEKAVQWQTVSEDMTNSARKHLFNNEQRAFYKGMLNDGRQITKNSVIDLSSFYGAFIYGLFDAKSDEISRAFETIQRTFGATTEKPGLPRYENDAYQRTSDSANGNWWFITTLWAAQYYSEIGDTSSYKTIIDWTLDQLDGSAMMAEQIDPISHIQLSVSPLTWSHAEFLSTILDGVSVGSKKT